jgi:hypothetical protein
MHTERHRGQGERRETDPEGTQLVKGESLRGKPPENHLSTKVALIQKPAVASRVVLQSSAPNVRGGDRQPPNVRGGDRQQTLSEVSMLQLELEMKMEIRAVHKCD